MFLKVDYNNVLKVFTFTNRLYIRMKEFLYTFSIFSFLVLVSCKQDNGPASTFYDLEGNWGIYEASRDKKKTTTLEDGHFTFADSIMTTNILGDKISGKYIMDNNSFKHQSSLPVSYRINFYKEDTMHLSTSIQGFKFEFKLHKILDSLEVNL